MRKFRWQLLIALGGILLIIGLLLGQAPPAPSLNPEPVSGGAHVEGLIGRPVRLNPLLAFDNQVDEDVNRLLFRGLVRFDSKGHPVPDLAAQWSISADATLVTVTLKDDIFWHDGEAVEAADIVYTFSKFKEEGYPGPPDLQQFWSDIDIVLLDESTVQFQLPEPFAPFLDFLSVGLLPDHLLRGVAAADLPDHPFNLDPVGTGPFQFERFLMEDDEIAGVSLLAFDQFDEELPYLDRVEFHYFEDLESALEAYRTGEIAAIGQVDRSILPTVLNDIGLNLYSARLPEVKLVYFNLDHAEKTYLDEAKLRQSLLLALNRQAIIDRTLEGQAIVSESPILPGTWAYADSLTETPFDPTMAGSMLDELDWQVPEGATPGSEEYLRSREEEPLQFEMIHADNPLDNQIATMIQEYWSAIGVQVELEAVEPQDLQEALEERRYETALTDLVLTRWPDPDPYVLWHDSQAETGQNYADFADRNSGIWLERARTNPDRGQRAGLYASFQHRFQDQLPALLLFYPVYNYAVTPEMQGVTLGPIFDPSDRFANIEEWFLLSRRGEPTPFELEQEATP
ncbi:MAG: peptide ABC transporter substrate-binding protein [Anaerolineales bacterium]